MEKKSGLGNEQQNDPFLLSQDFAVQKEVWQKPGTKEEFPRTGRHGKESATFPTLQRHHSFNELQSFG